MSCIVPRTCTEVPPNDVEPVRRVVARPLADLRTASVYVLLGDPGSGKSTSFEAEREVLGEEACLVTARDFLALEPEAHPEWRGKTLFIDGLDEVRAGAADARTPFDALRGRLDALGRPRFRLSCREADWLGTSDRENLARVCSDAGPTVLRLDPLSDENIVQILTAHPGIDARSFIAKAREKGVAGFLDNPQCLNMLADVVAGGGGWPGSRLELFERACLRMVREHNPERIAVGDRLSPVPGMPDVDLLDAAGCLCAVLLISGCAGCAVGPSREDADFPDLHRCAGKHRDGARRAVSTKLFRAVAEGRFQPIHRHVAEFLAGRHLSRVIKGEGRQGRQVPHGVPARRVVSLMTGHDGGVVTELRGLSAWIAALSRSARNEVVGRDPIGVGLYGDIGVFSPPERRDLLASLERASSRLHLTSGKTAAFASLVTSAMQPAFEEALRHPGRAPEHRAYVGFVLDVLCHGTRLPELADTLAALVRDGTWSPRVNAAALRAFLHHCPDGVEKTDRLKVLLADVHAGVVSDPREELRGLLLNSLYPREVSPSEVWRYLTVTEDTRMIGSSWHFWSQQIPDESTDEEMIELLDGLRQCSSRIRSTLETCWYARQTPMRLVARALDLRGDRIDIGRLYDWLHAGAVAVPDGRWQHEHHEAARAVRLWLENRADVQKAVLLEGLRRCPNSVEFSRRASDVRNCLYGARHPPDFGLWCLGQAVSLADTRLPVAEYLLCEAFRALEGGYGNESLSIDVIAAHVRQAEKLRPVWDLMTSPPGRSEDREERRRYEQQEQQHEDEWLACVQSEAAALEENRAAPALLFRMAQAYFGDLVNFHVEGGSKGVEKLLRGDPDLARAALAGLTGTIDRSDVPKIEEILDLRRRNRFHYLTWPFLAGLAEIDRTTEEDASRWQEGRIRKALVFHFCYPNTDYSPKWYRRLLEKRPELVADVLATVAASGFRDDGSDSAVFWALAQDPSHTPVARLASLRLLATFPTRCNAKQVRSLDCLLRAALQHADEAQLLELTDSKLRRRSMNHSQRVRWLACGAILAPERYGSRLRECVEGRERRVRHLADCLSQEPTLAWRPRLDKRRLELFIGLLAPHSDPDGWARAGVVTPAVTMSDHVSGMIRELATLPDEDATRTLEELAAEPKLSRWRTTLMRARDDQRLIRRDAAYRHPDVEQVCRTLQGGQPTNAGDLAALVMDRLDEIADRIRNGNTDDWRQYWNEDSHGRPVKPKTENSCRDALLSDLRPHLPDGVDAQPEGQHAGDRRADIRISCRDFQVPVEVKRNGHRDLWSALRGQLIAQYVRDPGADGHGIYLVFWFGDTDGHRTPPPPSGMRPGDPDALKKHLEELLTSDEARKISVCVIDVSAPSDLR